VVRDHLRRATAGEDIRNIRVWGAVGNKTDIVLEWPRARAARSGKHDPNSVRGLDGVQEGSRRSRFRQL